MIFTMNKVIYFVAVLIAFLALPRSTDAVAYDLNSNTQYHLRIDGAALTDKLSNYGLTAADLNGNGKDDLIVIAVGTDYNSRNASGSLYIFYDSLLDDYLTKGNTLDLNTSTSYNIRIDGPAANGGIVQVSAGDINNDGAVDLVISGDTMDFNSRSNSGSVYVLYNSIFSGFSGTGNTLDLNTSTSYNLRIDGATASDRFGTYTGLKDIDQNSKLDLFASAWAYAGQGSTYLIKDSILDDYTTTGNTIELATTTNFNVRWDGGSAISFGLGTPVSFGDLDNDDKQDLIFTSSYTDYNSRSDSGSTWIVFNTLLDDNVGTGNIINISSSANYNVRIDGTTTEYYLRHAPIGKLNLSGEDNIFLYEFPNAVSGAIYVVGNSLISTFAGTTGNTLDLADAGDFNLKITSADGDWPFGLELADYTNDTYNEFIVGANYAAQNSRADSGSTYILSGSALNSYLATTGNTLNISSASDYLFRFDGNAAADYSPYKYDSGDFNGDGVLDTVITSQDSDFNSRNNSGSLWLIYGFPHTVDADSTAVTTSDTTPTLTGSVTATNSLSTVASVAYRVDSNTVTGSWTACTASDGTFNSTSESYTCTLSTQTGGAHTVYIRSTDSNGVITAQSAYESISLTVDATGPTYSDVVGTHTSNTALSITYTTSEAASTQLEYGLTTSYGTTTTESDTSPRVTSHEVALTGLEPCTKYHYRLLGSDSVSNSGSSADYTAKTGGCAQSSGGTDSSTAQIMQEQSADEGGIFKPIRDSYTGNQVMSVVVESNTLSSDAYVSSVMTSPSAGGFGLLANPLAPQLPLTGILPGNAFLVGGDNGKLGIRSACGTSWQVGNIQQIWFKTLPASSDKKAAIIIPELQKKPSILALSYTDFDLVPPGQPGSKFSQDSLKLAHSLDGRSWSVLPTSVVDSQHSTVAALDKIGGYYMIVSGCESQSPAASTLGATTQLFESPFKNNQSPDVTPPVSSFEETEDIPKISATPQLKTNQNPSLFQKIATFVRSLF